MNVYKEVTCSTSDEQQITQVDELVGVIKPFAFAINYKAHGYGKFIIDEMSLNAFESNLKHI